MTGIENLIGTNHALPDFLTGNAGANRLEGLAGDDVLTGLGGNDRFVFRPDSGPGTITDFVAGAGTEDVIDLAALPGFGSFAEAQAVASQVGADTVIDLGNGNSITLLGVNVSTLHQDDVLL